MIVIGSHAAHLHHPELWPNPTDLDVVLEYDEFLGFVEEREIAVVPVSKNKFVGEWHGKMIEFDIAWPGSSNAMLIERVNGSVREIHGVMMLVPDMDWLFMLKASHRYKKDDVHFEKTLHDYHRMKYELGCEISDSEWFALREAETYLKKRPRLNTSMAEFFTDAAVVYEYDHDTLHVAVAHMGKPAYEFYKADNSEVMCSRAKWDACSERPRLYGVLEECYVLALERSQIPHGHRISPRESFMIALEKVCTSITSGWFREYAYENYFNILDMYSDEYVVKFEQGLRDGVVLKARKTA